jgi:hypothetical protein
MLYRKLIALCAEIHTEHINLPCEHNAELLYVKSGGTQSNRQESNGKEICVTYNFSRSKVAYKILQPWLTAHYGSSSVLGC